MDMVVKNRKIIAGNQLYPERREENWSTVGRQESWENISISVRGIGKRGSVEIAESSGK